MNLKFLIVLSLLCFSGKIYPDVMKQNPFVNKFFTGAFNAPPKNECTQKQVNEIADAGVDLIITGGDKKYFSSFLNYAEKADVKVIPIGGPWRAMINNTNNQITFEAVKKITANYSKRPAFMAYGVYDEPAADLYPRLAECSKMIIKADPKHPPLINLLPSYGSPIQLGAPNFRAYVSDYIKIVKPYVVCYDYYPFREGATLFDGWHNDLKIVREESRNANIPFWVFVQSEGIKGGLKVPTREEIFWQANTALAYGARGILWFCYWTPPYYPKSKMHEKHYSAMIDIKGKKTKIYDYVKEENKFLQSAGRSIADWDNKFVAQYKSGKLIYGKSPFGNPKGKNLNLIVGTFTKEKNTRIVFSSDNYDKKINFSFEKKKFKIINSFHTKLQNNNFEIQPGGCVIIELLISNSNNKKGDK
jgi:hypothetical protein